MRKVIGLLVVGLALSAAASADVLIGNFNAAVGTGTIFGPGTTSIYKAFGWTMPAGNDYYLDSATLTMRFNSQGTALVSIWDGASTPQNKLVTLNNPNQVGSGDFKWTPSSPFIMEAGKNYWVYLEAASGSDNWYWEGTTPSTVPGGPASPINYIFNGNPSSTRNRLQIEGTIVPEPAAITLLAVAGLLIRRR